MSVQVLIRCSVVAVLAATACGLASADDDVEPPSTPARDLRDAANAPGLRVERVDTANLATPSAPGYRTDLTQITVQRWIHRGPAGVGVGIGTLSLVNRPTGLLPGQAVDAVGAVATGTVLTVGMRVRATDTTSFYADTAHVRGLGLEGDDRVVGKVGMEFKAAQSNWKVAYGGLGFRFAGDTRMTVKVRRSGVTLMMRRAF